MAAKQGSVCGAFVTVVFGTVLAPVLVNLTNKEVNHWVDGGDSAHPSQCIRVVTRGVGRTQEEAFRNVRRNAVRIVATNVLGAVDEGALAQCDGCVRDVEDLGGVRVGDVWEKEAAVTVAASELTEALRPLVRRTSTESASPALSSASTLAAGTMAR